MNDLGELAQPTVYNGVMYVVNGKWTFAIDVETGRQIWRTPRQKSENPRITRAAFNRGAATIYNGKAVSGDDRQASARPRHEDGQGAVEPEVRRMRNGLLRHRRADRCQRRPDFGHGGRRIDHARIPRRLGSRYRKETVAPIHNSCARRNRLRNMAEGQRSLDQQGGGPTWITGSYDPELDLSTGARQRGP